MIQHAFSQGGAYPVTLTVRDDLGQSVTINQVVTVARGLTATFTTAPNNPTAGATITFDGSASSSTVASTISNWE